MISSGADLFAALSKNWLLRRPRVSRRPSGIQRSSWEPGRRRHRLGVPSVLPAGLRCDTIEVSEDIGPALLACLPRIGCVTAEGDRWWWVVPEGSDIDVVWPSIARYEVGAVVTVPYRGEVASRFRGRRLIHWPADAVPYTHPLLLYIAVCRIADVPPVWSRGEGEDRHRPERVP